MSGSQTYGEGSIIVELTPEAEEAYSNDPKLGRDKRGAHLGDWLAWDTETTGSILNGKLYEYTMYHGDHYGYHFPYILEVLKPWVRDGKMRFVDEEMRIWELEIKNHELYINTNPTIKYGNTQKWSPRVKY